MICANGVERTRRKEVTISKLERAIQKLGGIPFMRPLIQWVIFGYDPILQNSGPKRVDKSGGLCKDTFKFQ